MIHPDTALRLVSDNVGYGLIATAKIPRGTVVWVQDPFDIVLQPSAIDRLPDALRKAVARYAYKKPSGEYVVAWDFGRFMNHSCDPSTVALGALCDIAARDIMPGEELTGDYATMNVEDMAACACGSPKCRKSITAADLAKVAPRIDAIGRDSVARLLALPQPLLDVASLDDRDRILAIAGGTAPFPSSLENQVRGAGQQHPS